MAGRKSVMEAKNIKIGHIYRAICVAEQFPVTEVINGKLVVKMSERDKFAVFPNTDLLHAFYHLQENDEFMVLELQNVVNNPKIGLTKQCIQVILLGKEILGWMPIAYIRDNGTVVSRVLNWEEIVEQ